MKIELNWQKRAAILLALSLILLSIVLAVMAIREADRQRLVSQREAEAEKERAASAVSDQAKSILSGIENRVISALPASLPELTPDELAAALKLILENPENKALLSEVFLLDSAANISFPAARPLYLFPGEKPAHREIPPEITSNELWREAEDAEFKRRDFTQAAGSYEQLLSRFSAPTSRPFILCRLARCHEKTGNPQRALALYQEVARAARPELASEGIPLDLMAMLQTGDIQLRTNRPLEAAKTFLALYESLLQTRWALTRSQFDFYQKRAAAQVQSIQAQHNYKEVTETWGLLTQLEEVELRRMSRLENIRQSIVPLVIARMRELPFASSSATAPSPAPSSFPFFRLSALSGEDLLLVSCRPLGANAAVGLVINPGALAGRLLPLDPAKLTLRKEWLIRLDDESGRAVVAGEELPASETPPAAPQLAYSGAFEDDFPPWKISIYQVGPDSSRHDFFLRRNFYILLVVVVIAALFLGGYLAVRSTAKELQLAKLKSDFVSTVSHEFRTPLTSIRYLAELLERGRVKDEERKQQYFRTISGESDRLNRLVENILDFSKIEAGMKEYRMEEADIAALTRDVASRLLEQPAYSKVALKTEIAEGMPEISLDSEAFSRALFNLLDNAAKYSGQNPQITLRAWSEAGEVCFQVEDNGIGISPADQKRIFQKFYRSGAAMAGSVKGSGIGLTLVDHIVKAHGGTISLESEPGKGTKVTIRLPLRPAQKSREDRHG
jgi:signal transduction histidine kinase